MRRIDLADPECEPTDEEFEGLLHRAMDDARHSHDRATARIRDQIREQRATVLAQLREPPAHSQP